MKIDKVSFKRKGCDEIEHGYRLEYEQTFKTEIIDLKDNTVVVEEWAFGWLDSFDGLQPSWNSQR